jgi:A/G-specific adenine glycosylase
LRASTGAFARTLLGWYAREGRDLPWRRTSDPYAIWISEVMLQQTRVETVIPYYGRFLARFPTIEELATAPEAELLTQWAGLGYYSRARNLRRAARKVVEMGEFPRTYEAIHSLAGVGDYTAAAIASIAFGEPRAVLDGNVMRVMARVTNDAGDIGVLATRRRLASSTAARLDPKQPGEYNQAVMELGATLCTPATPNCDRCPVARYCEARREGRERELPVKASKDDRQTARVTLLVVTRGDRTLLWQRGPESKRLAGFWELPDTDMLPGAHLLEEAGSFRHAITNTAYTITVRRASIARKPRGCGWKSRADIGALPLSTTARKALLLL